MTVIQQASGTNWTAIAGIFIAGVVGPVVGYWAAWRSDLRRFHHERRLDARDDLVRLLDDVEAALDNLGEKCADMRSQVVQHAGGPEVGPSLIEAQRAFQHARALIARLRMRPYADQTLIEQAQTAANEMQKAIHLARTAIVSHRAGMIADEMAAAVGVPDAVEHGYTATEEYETLAREAVGRLIGADT
jgi:hypothetical protein